VLGLLQGTSNIRRLLRLRQQNSYRTVYQFQRSLECDRF
jgi:hypothetical protein